jgi:hypothetical protein
MLQGKDFFVSPTNPEDRAAAANAAVQSQLAEEAHTKLVETIFETQSDGSISLEDNILTVIVIRWVVL